MYSYSPMLLKPLSVPTFPSNNVGLGIPLSADAGWEHWEGKRAWNKEPGRSGIKYGVEKGLVGKSKENMQVDFPKCKDLGHQAPGPRSSLHPALHSYLFVNLCKLFQVVLKKGNLLLLGMNPPTVLGLHFCTLNKDRGGGGCPEAKQVPPRPGQAADTRPKGWRDRRTGGECGGGEEPEDGTHFLDSSRDVLNEQFAKVVEGLEFPGLERMIKDWGSQIPAQPFHSEITGTFSPTSQVSHSSFRKRCGLIVLQTDFAEGRREEMKRPPC